MTVAKVYRPEFDKFKGQIVGGKLDPYYVGDVADVILGGAAPQPVGRFPGLVGTEGQIGIPYAQDSEIVVQQHDRLLINNVLYAVNGPRQWEEDHTFSGTDVTEDYYWMEVEAQFGGTQ